MTALESLAAEIAQCTKCLLHRGRTKAVPGEGPENADVMFIGEAPGFHEDQQGLPFVGAAGQQFLQKLASLSMTPWRVILMLASSSSRNWPASV